MFNQPLFVEGWPVVHRHRFFKNGDIVMCKYNGRLGVVVDEAPNSTYPGDISVATKESLFTRGHYESPDGYKLVWRDHEIY